LKAVEAFFKACEVTTGIHSSQITTDKEPAFPSAINKTFGDGVKHRGSKYINNVMEQSHRSIKSRYRPMKGFQDNWCAMIFCTTFEEIKQSFRMRNKIQSQRCHGFAPKFQEFEEMVGTAA
jgi:transposase-like protein